MVSSLIDREQVIGTRGQISRQNGVVEQRAYLLLSSQARLAQCRSGLSWLNARQTPVVHSGLHAFLGQTGRLHGTDRGSPLSEKTPLLVVTRTRLIARDLGFAKLDEGAEYLGD